MKTNYGEVIGNIIYSNGEKEVGTVDLSLFISGGILPLNQYGDVGSAVIYDGEIQTIYQLDINVKNQGILLFYDGVNILPTKVNIGLNSVFVKTKSNKYGLILLSNNVQICEITIENITPITLPDSSISYFTLGNVTPNVLGNLYKLSSNSGGKTIKNLITKTGCQELTSRGVKGSLLTLSGLDNGTYSFDVLIPKKDVINPDVLYAYDGHNLTLIADTSQQILNQIEIINEFITFIAMDVIEKKGNTEFIINKLKKVSELEDISSKLIPLLPVMGVGGDYGGNVKFTENSVQISTSTGSLSTQEFIDNIGLDIELINGQEGSYINYYVPNGKYEITYSLYSNENEINQDKIYFFDGADYEIFADRIDADIPKTSTGWISEIKTKQVEVINGTLGIFVVDEVDKSGTTSITIYKIIQLPRTRGVRMDNSTQINNQLQLR